MPAGLQVWDAAGNLIFDTGDRAGRIIASINLPNSGGLATNVNATLNPAIPAGVQPFFVVTYYDPTIYQIALNVNSIGGSTVNYNSNGAFTIMYGYY